MESQSIHPRVVNGRQKFPKVDTSKPHKGGGKLEKRRKRRNARRLDREATVKQPHVKAEAFRVPGSMNQHK